MSLAVVRDLRVARAPVTAEDLAALQTDVLAGFVLARVRDSAGGSVAAVPERPFARLYPSPNPRHAGTQPPAITRNSK